MGEEKWDSILDSLANGIEIRLHLKLEIPDRAIRDARYIAQKLNVPNDVINTWAQNRKTHSTDIECEMARLVSIIKKCETAHLFLTDNLYYRQPPGSSNDYMN